MTRILVVTSAVLFSLSQVSSAGATHAPAQAQEQNDAEMQEKGLSVYRKIAGWALLVVLFVWMFAKKGKGNVELEQEIPDEEVREPADDDGDAGKP